MQQMNIERFETVLIDYEKENVPSTVKEFKPSIYKEGESFCCVLGPDPQKGIFGCGKTAPEAMEDWDKHVQERIKQHTEGDEVAEYIIDSIAASKWVVL